MGLDISPSCIAAIELRYHRGRIAFVRSLLHKLPIRIFHDDQIADWALLESELVRFVQLHHLHHHVVAISLPRALVKIHTMTVPASFTDEDIVSEITFYLEHELSLSNETAGFDFNVVKCDREQKEVLWVSVAKNDLTPYIQMVEQSGLKVKVVDVDEYALERAHEATVDSLPPLSPLYTKALGLAMRENSRW